MFNPYVLLAIGVAWLASLVGAFHFGEKHVEGAWQAKMVVAEKSTRMAQDKAAAEARKQDDITRAKMADLDAKLVAALGAVRENTKIIVREVPRYVTVAADSKCVVPVGFVRVHDAAASNRPANAAEPAAADGGNVDADSGLALSGVAATVADNYGTYHEAVTKLAKWREFWPTVVEHQRKMQEACGYVSP